MIKDFKWINFVNNYSHFNEICEKIAKYQNVKVTRYMNIYCDESESQFIQKDIPNYEYMYEKFIINSAPEELPERLVKLLEKLVLR